MRIARASTDDLHALASLVCDVEAHYGGSASAQDVARSIAPLLQPRERAPFALLARTADGTPAGFATLSPFFPVPVAAWGLYLEELFVLPPHRGQGLGRALLRHAAAHALDGDYRTLFWTTTTDNRGARALYDRLLGAPTGNLHYQATGSTLAALASKD